MIFADHRIQENMLEDLTKDMLYDMGIKTIGDIIAILKHAREVADDRIQRELMSKHNSETQRSRMIQPPAVNKVTTTNRPISGPSVSSSTTVRNLKRKSVGDESTLETDQSSFGPKIRRVISLSDADRITITNTNNSVKGLQRVVNFPDKKAASNAHQDDKNQSVFTRLGAGSSAKKDIVVTRVSKMPSTITRVISGNSKITIGNSSASSVKDRLSISKKPGRLSLGNERKIVSSSLKPKQALKGKTISLKKSVYDRLGPKTY